jgi:hypothetical protein
LAPKATGVPKHARPRADLDFDEKHHFYRIFCIKKDSPKFRASITDVSDKNPQFQNWSERANPSSKVGSRTARQ